MTEFVAWCVYSCAGFAATLASVGGVGESGAGHKGPKEVEADSKAGLLKSLAVRAMSEAEYVSTGTLSERRSADNTAGNHAGAPEG